MLHTQNILILNSAHIHYTFFLACFISYIFLLSFFFLYYFMNVFCMYMTAADIRA